MPSTTIKRIDVNDGFRLYKTPDGVFPSISTVLSWYGKVVGNNALENWIKNIGENEANRKRNIAGRRGDILHKLCEDFVMGNPHTTKGLMPDTIEQFNKIKPYLKNITNPIGCEISLYCPKLRLAGTTDCIGDYENFFSIIDFKNSTRQLIPEVINKYRIQSSAYCYMYKHVYGVFPEQYVLVGVTLEEYSAWQYKGNPTKQKEKLDFIMNSWWKENETLVRIHS